MNTRHWAWAGFTECPKCGGTVYMMTESTTPQEFHEGDAALCTGCGAEGEFEFDLEGDLGFINWHNAEDKHYEAKHDECEAWLKSASHYSLMQTS